MEKGLLNQKSLADYLDMSLSNVYRLRKRPDFPRPIKFTENEFSGSAYWRRKSVDEWLESLGKPQAQVKSN